MKKFVITFDLGLSDHIKRRIMCLNNCQFENFQTCFQIPIILHENLLKLTVHKSYINILNTFCTCFFDRLYEIRGMTVKVKCNLDIYIGKVTAPSLSYLRVRKKSK